MISLHAEVPASGDILEMHDLVDNIEQELSKTLGCQAVIHMDPILTDDAQTNELRARVAALVHGIDEQATIHDFRIDRADAHEPHLRRGASLRREDDESGDGRAYP